MAALFGVGLFLAASSPTTNIMSQSSTALQSTSKVIALSSKKDAKVKTASADTAKAQTPAPQMVTVNPGDYLTKIADANNTTALRLFYANTDIKDPDLIYPGQQLRVPTNDEQLTPREVPSNTQISSTPTATAAPAPRASQQTQAANIIPSDGSVWDRIAACESGGNWSI